MKKVTKLFAIRCFVNTVLGEQIIIAKKREEDNNMAMYVNGKQPRLSLSKNLDHSSDYREKIFRADFVDRCPMAQGFANITLSLLHECGHWATRSVLSGWVYIRQCEKAENMYDYLNIPYEHLATDWAIAWLQNPDNRRLAKFFERLFFDYDIE